MTLSAPIDVEHADRDELVRHIDALETKLAAFTGVDDRLVVSLIRDALEVTRTQAAICFILKDGKRRSRDAIMDYLYADRPDDPPGDKILDVYVSKMRKKLAVYGIRIENCWGYGFRLAEGSAVITSILREEPIRQTDCKMQRKPTAPERILAVLTERQKEAGRGVPIEVTTSEIADELDLFWSVAPVFRKLAGRGQLTIVSVPEKGRLRNGRRSLWRLIVNEAAL